MVYFIIIFYVVTDATFTRVQWNTAEYRCIIYDKLGIRMRLVNCINKSVKYIDLTTNYKFQNAKYEL